MDENIILCFVIITFYRNDKICRSQTQLESKNELLPILFINDAILHLSAYGQDETGHLYDLNELKLLLNTLNNKCTQYREA